jgi:hypothetical protein
VVETRGFGGTEEGSRSLSATEETNQEHYPYDHHNGSEDDPRPVRHPRSPAFFRPSSNDLRDSHPRSANAWRGSCRREPSMSRYIAPRR